MVSQVFTAQPCVQPLHLPQPPVVFNKDVWKKLHLNQQENNNKYQADLTDTVKNIDEMTKTLASQHHKSVWTSQGSEN